MIIIIRGGGDLASGVAVRLHRAGLRLVITELPQPLVVRRQASFAEAVYSHEVTLEGISACRTDHADQALQLSLQGVIPVLVDPDLTSLSALQPIGILVDGRMRKQPPEADLPLSQLAIGLGPGFIAGENCDAVIETQRGPYLGRVIWQGSAQPDTGFPEGMAPYDRTRVLRSPADGVLETLHEIGDSLKAGQPVAHVAGQVVLAPFDGMLRGLLHPGLTVWRGLKIGDVDPRLDPLLCSRVSDKALAVAGGVLEAILSRGALRPHLWE